MEAEPNILTKFTKYYDSYFDLEQTPKIKMSLASEFNDIFDSQIYLDPENIKVLANYYSMSYDLVDFLTKRMSNFSHILSLSARSALDIDAANMWGIYADNGKGIALEFDYLEIADRFNSYYSKSFVDNFYKIDNADYPSALLTLEQIKYEKVKRKLEFAKTDAGIKGLLNIYSHAMRTKLGRKAGIFEDYYNELKQGIVSTRTVMTILPIIEESQKNPNRHIYLYKVEYVENHVEWLHNSLYTMFSKERRIQDNQYKESDIIERQLASFIAKKSKIWEYENEYRVVTPYYYHRDYGKVKKNNLKEHKIALDKFIEKNKNPESMYFYNFSELPVEDIEDAVDGVGAIGLINMPFPQKIYLGWKFNEEPGFLGKYYKIKQFCEKHSIELIQLKNYFNFKTGLFSTEMIL